ncbi:MAG: cytochrome-c peroxidase [Bacteroidia bacterium]
MNKVVYISISLLLLISACKKDPSEDGVDRPYITTPYEMYIPSSLPPANFPDDNIPSVEGVELGRMLFYDPILSGDSTQSCADCHNQEFAFTDNELALSVGIRGLEGGRNSMPIFNLMWHRDGFFWDGRAELLRHQAVLPIQDELEMDETIGNLLAKLSEHPGYSTRFKQVFNVDEITEETVGLALEQFMMIIISGESKFDIGRTMQFSNFTPSEMRGLESFNAEAIENDSSNTGGDCFHCHGAPLFMIKGFMNNGLDTIFADVGRAKVTGDKNDEGKFKVPSLRNIEKSGPYMHDGRFNTLDEVLEFYANGAHFNSPNINANMHALQNPVYLSPQTRADLIAFMKTLTDNNYLNNEDYTNPF